MAPLQMLVNTSKRREELGGMGCSASVSFSTIGMLFVATYRKKLKNMLRSRLVAVKNFCLHSIFTPTHSEDASCCDFCSYLFCTCDSQSICQSCKANLSSIELNFKNVASHVKLKVRSSLSSSSESLTKAELLELSSGCRTLPSNVRSVYFELIENILENIEYICNVRDILNMGAFSVDDASRIMCAIDKYTTPLSLDDSFSTLTL